MTAAHSVVPPSGLSRIIQCPASLKLEARYPETEPSPEAAEGTAAHWVLERAMQGLRTPEGTPTPNGVIVTGEMIEGAMEAVATVSADLAPYGMTLRDVVVERPVAIHDVHPQCWGTPDLRAWVPAGRNGIPRPLLLLWDYKFGHRPVSAIDNPQLAAYAKGALRETKLHDLDADMCLSIIQPRAFASSVRWWKASAADLRASITIANRAAHDALGDDPRSHTGPECRDCRARHACTTLQRAGYVAVEMSGAMQAQELPPDALGLELKTLMAARDRLDARITGLEESARAAALAGRRVAWFRVERKTGRLGWTVPADAAIATAAACNVDIRKPAAALTPLQAIAAGVPEAIVNSLATRPTGSPTLVLDDGTEARRVFG